MVSGIVALMLEANPELTWRDVQGVLIMSTIKNDLNDTDWSLNGAGLWFNHKYGFGFIDSYNAVQIAKKWINLLEPISFSTVRNISWTIPEEGSIDIPLTVDIDFIVEHVEIYFNATHPKRGDLQIELVSPSGTVSLLAEPHQDQNKNYDWTFGSIACWGENSIGDWTIKVYDKILGYHGYMVQVGINVYGH